MSLTAKVYIVGAGPGDPELITLKGKRIIEQADLILYTDSLVNEKLLAQVKDGAIIQKSAGMDLQTIVATMVKAVREGKSVARVHTGDPAVYGAIFEQIAMLQEQGIEVEIVPGVSSVFAAAAVVGAELTIPDLTQTVILTRVEGRTPVPDREQLRKLASYHCTIALFLSATLTKRITSELMEAGWSAETPVVIVYKATWPEQKIVRTTVGKLDEAMRQTGIRSQAMILAGWALDPFLYQRKEVHRSKLYDKTFTHGFRQGRDSR